jgi:uncharacterized protein
MDYAYFDTSALIKRYVDEPGRPAVVRLLRTRHCIVSALLPLEIHSALRRRVSDRTLDAKRAQTIATRLASDRQLWTSIEVSREVLSKAEAICAVYPLRALDAVHVASANLFASQLPGFVFVSADARQTAAATALAMPTRLIE